MLYHWYELRKTAEVLRVSGGKCKHCGAKLRTDGFKVGVERIDESVTYAPTVLTQGQPVRSS